MYSPLSKILDIVVFNKGVSKWCLCIKPRSLIFRVPAQLLVARLKICCKFTFQGLEYILKFYRCKKKKKKKIDRFKKKKVNFEVST